MDKQRTLLPTDAAPQLHDDVATVVRVPGQQQELQFLLQLFQPFPGVGQFLLGQFPEIRIMEQFLRLFPVRQGLAVGVIGLHHRAQFLQIPVDAFQLVHIAVNGRVRQLSLQVLIPQGQLL